MNLSERVCVFYQYISKSSEFSHISLYQLENCVCVFFFWVCVCVPSGILVSEYLLPTIHAEVSLLLQCFSVCVNSPKAFTALL